MSTANTFMYTTLFFLHPTLLIYDDSDAGHQIREWLCLTLLHYYSYYSKSISSIQHFAQHVSQLLNIISSLHS